MTRYSLGFLFSSNLSRVLLVTKNRPDWQAGKLNGVGGHTNENETDVQSISRESLEEINLIGAEWVFAGEMNSVDWVCFVFAAIYAEGSCDLRAMTDEQFHWYRVDELHQKPILGNVLALVHLCLSKLKSDELESFSLTYKQRE